MQKVLTAEQMREVDRLTTERYGIPSIILMENAAHAVARVITEKLGGSVKDKSILILCGPGNNGGDGAALARILQLSGADSELVLFGLRDSSKGDAKANFDSAYEIVGRFDEIGTKEEWKYWFENSGKAWTVVVDAIFGTGLSRPIEGFISDVIHDILGDNACGRFERNRVAVSVDLPSGLIADDADATGPVLEADCTVTFTAPKPSNVLANSYSLGGELFVADIGSSWALIDEQSSKLFLSTERDAFIWLSRSDFNYDSYKNKRGHALVIVGSESYSGAAVLVGDAAMRSGVGLVTVATPKSSKDSIAARVLPEVMVKGVAETDGGAVAEEAFDELHDLLEKADSVAVGSGLSQSDSTRKFVQKVIEDGRQPIIVDADALNLLSPFDHVMQKPARKQGRNTQRPDHALTYAPACSTETDEKQPLILTPHEGEFMRLLGTSDKAAIKDRVAAVRDFAVKHNVILVLKGERVLIGEPGGKVVVNPTGNSGLGKAGNGDTLTGILAGFVAQATAMKIDIFETVVAAVYVAGMAGDIAEKKYGKRVMTASDVRECLVEVFAALGAAGS